MTSMTIFTQIHQIRTNLVNIEVIRILKLSEADLYGCLLGLLTNYAS